MQAAQLSTGYTDLFASLQTVQSTVQAQIERFNGLMSEIQVVAAARQDEEGANAVGNVALKLHRVHALLYSGSAVVPQTEPQGERETGATELDLEGALSEFSALLANSQSTSQEVAALLDAATEELARLRDAAN